MVTHVIIFPGPSLSLGWETTEKGVPLLFVNLPTAYFYAIPRM